MLNLPLFLCSPLPTNLSLASPQQPEKGNIAWFPFAPQGHLRQLQLLTQMPLKVSGEVTAVKS